MVRVPRKAAEIGVFRERTTAAPCLFQVSARAGFERFFATEVLHPVNQPRWASQDWTALSGHRHYHHPAGRIGFFAKRRERYY
jgi:hypothetical protein